jgi:hypothetical protein
MATVSYPPEVLARLRRWGEIAVRAGLRDAFLAALRNVEERLRTDPETWGDPLRDFSKLRLTYYRGYSPVLIVYYTVHIAGTPVFVHEVVLNPNSDLFGLAE